MAETVFQSERAAAPYLVAAARVAHKVGLGLPVQVVIPRRTGIVRRAERIAREVGVDIEFTASGERSVRAVFSSVQGGSLGL